ncbi:hypothetical protein MTR67_030484 [Solanum verrucosum]|uniref:Ubiquitin-like protease family profile domain-containing protein n=1 Tax=Solanum verrucosum TaxID=315347 RepID=A0AAF0RE34_SOLVR|nr:hypothetical protein MTR67_030484 [Solanum verrucosum]
MVLCHISVKKMLTDQHIDVVLYYLRKKSKLRSPNKYRFTTVNCLFKTFINDVYNRYYCSASDDNLTTQEHMTRGAVVSAIESDFFDQTERTNWSSLDAYKDSQTGMLLEPNVTFKVEFTQDIMQQQCDSLDCGIYVTAYAEYLSDGIPVLKIGFHSDYLCTRYGALLW